MSAEIKQLREAAAIVPPNSLEAEAAVLGALLLEPAATLDLPATLRAEDFYRTQHRLIFSTILALADARLPIDALTVVERLRTAGQIELAGGASYIAGLPDAVPSLAHLAHYAAIVLETATRRRLILAHTEALGIARDESVPTPDARLRCEQVLAGVDDEREQSSLVDAKAVAKQMLVDLDAKFDGKGVERGIATGLKTLDRELFIHPTDFVVIGGRPGEGKSVLLWQIARHVAREMPVLFASLEMNPSELGARAVMDLGELHVADVRHPRNDAASAKLVQALEDFAKLDITLSRSRDPIALLREATRQKRKRGLGLLVIDYVQRVRVPHEWGENRDQRIGELTRRLKDFADDEQVPVLAAAQLKRIDHLQRGRDPRPGLEDLRESGNIEADANAVALIYRPGMVPGTDEHKASDTRTTELLIPKQRSGDASLSIPLVAQFEFGRFREPIHPEPDAQQTMGFGR